VPDRIAFRARSGRREDHMNQLLESLLTINLIFGTAVFYVGARIYVLPKVGISDPRAILKTDPAADR
jgi:hypothetical protein